MMEKDWTAALTMLTLLPSVHSVAVGSPAPSILPMRTARSPMGVPLVARAAPMVCMAISLARSRTSGGMSSYFKLAVNSARVEV